MKNISFILALFLSSFAYSQENVENHETQPKKIKFFNESSPTVSNDQSEALNKRLSDLRDETQSQFLILTLPSLDGKDIDTYTAEIAPTLGINADAANKNVLFLLFTGERRMRIEVGGGLKNRLNGDVIKDITSNLVAPKFKEGDFYMGFNAAIDKIAHEIRVEIEESAKAKQAAAVKSAKEAEEAKLRFVKVGSTLLGVIICSLLIYFTVQHMIQYYNSGQANIVAPNPYVFTAFPPPPKSNSGRGHPVTDIFTSDDISSRYEKRSGKYVDKKIEKKKKRTTNSTGVR